jgi:hypothetical protein
MLNNSLFFIIFLISLLTGCNEQVIKHSDRKLPVSDEQNASSSQKLETTSSSQELEYDSSINTSPGFGSTLHAIIAADTHDETIGKSVEIDLENIKTLLRSIQQNTGLGLQTHSFSGEQLTRNNVNLALNQLSVEPNDVVIFYYSGHGINLNKGSKWPALVFGGRFLNLDKVRDQIKAKNPRFFMVLADACNNLAQVISSHRGVGDKGRPLPKNYQSLFLNYRGNIIASSSIPGQKSWGSHGQGGFFTHAFLTHLIEELASSSTPNWQTIMERAKQPLPTDDPEHPFQHPQYTMALQQLQSSVPPSKPSPSAGVTPSAPLPISPISEISTQIAPSVNDHGQLSIKLLPNAPFRLGDKMRIAVDSPKQGYLFLWDINSGGQISRLFPNQYSQQHQLNAGKTKTIPENAFSGFGFSIVKPVGRSILVGLLVKPSQVQTVLSQRFLSSSTAEQSLQRLRQQLKQSLGKNHGPMSTVDYQIRN